MKSNRNHGIANVPVCLRQRLIFKEIALSSIIRAHFFFIIVRYDGIIVEFRDDEHLYASWTGGRNRRGKCALMKTIIYYLSATGNSLYVARTLRTALEGVELRSISEALAKSRFDAEADAIGFVFPLHYMGLPLQAETFLERMTITGNPYIFAIATCGIPYIGTPFIDAKEILSRKGQQLNAAWYLRLVSNYIPMRDIAANWRIRIRAWLAERKLRNIGDAIEKRESHSTWQLLQTPCRRIHQEWKDRRPRIDENFRCDTERCTSCGLCERVCPAGNILRPDGHPVWQHRCTECLGCLHICPVEAIDYGDKTKGRKRYRHKDIAPKDLMQPAQETID